MPTRTAKNSLLVLLYAHAAREKEITRQEPIRHVDSDDEADSACPVLDSLDSDGVNQALMKLTNFTAPELLSMYGTLHEFIITNWNVGRGRKIVTKA